MCEATWAAASANGAEDVAITAWDFAGQDDYFLTHAYFLQRRCEHVIVSRARVNEAEREGECAVPRGPTGGPLSRGRCAAVTTTSSS